EGLCAAPDMRDLWFDIADLHAEQQRWEASYEASCRGLAIAPAPGSVANDYLHAGGRPFHRASLAAQQLGLIAEARSLAAAAVGREPGSEEYQRRLRELSP